MRRILALPVLLALSLTSCSLAGGDDDPKDADGKPTEVVLVTHESFVLPDDLVAQFEEESGYDLTVKASGDAGALTNKLVLTKENPTGDVAFGVDNTFASRALDEDVFAKADGVERASGAGEYDLPGDGADYLVPVDTGNVCMNVDTTYFTGDLPAPVTLEDLTEPAYKDLLVLPGATTSSPGLAFLLTTVAAFGDDWPSYWEDLLANGAKLTEGWTDAYQVEFTQGGGGGDRPIVLSYDSSPAFTVDESGTASTTRALLETCFQQVEYAGVLAGADNPEGAAELISFLETTQVQEALPDAMYVFPVDANAKLPNAWAEFAVRPVEPWSVDPADIDANREQWLTEWSDLVSR